MEELHSTEPKLSQKSLKQTGQSSNHPGGDGDVVGIADANSNGGSEGIGERVFSIKRLTVEIKDCKRYSIGNEPANSLEKHGVKNSANANSPSKASDVLQVLFFFHLCHIWTIYEETYK